MDALIEQFRSHGGHETYAVASSDDVGRTEQGIGAEGLTSAVPEMVGAW